VSRSNLSEEERYWAKVDRCGEDECWEWTAATNCSGYGIFLAGGTCVLAHRFGWLLATGEDPGDLCVLHRCDNPRCQNPAHHFLGTRADNAADRNAKGRQARGERMGSAVLTEELVREANRLYRSGMSIPKIAEQLGVKKGTLNSVRRGLSWGHLGLDWSARRGRLDPEKVRAIRRRVEEGESLSKLADEFCIGRHWVQEVAAGRVWKSVP
jgi:transposase-like protein